MSRDRRLPRAGGWLLAFVAALGLVGAYLRSRNKPPMEVQVERVGRGRVRELIAASASGRVEPAQRVTLRAEVAASVLEVKSPRGGRVEKGALLVLFLSDELEARVSQAQANLDAAKVSIKMAASRQSSARRAKERAEKLRQGGAISDAELERAVAELDAADLALAQSEAASKQALAALKLAQVTAERARVLAPFAGIVQDVFVDPGVQVAPGAPLLDLIDDSSVFVEAPIDEADIGRIAVGQVALLSTHAGREEAATGKVRFIPPAVGRSDAGGSARIVASGGTDRSVYIEVLPDDPGRLRIGSSVNVEILVREKPDTLYVSSQAVMGRGVRREVFVLTAGRVERKSFEAGLTSWERTEVLSGLREGEEVVSRLDTPDLEAGQRAVGVRAAVGPEAAATRNDEP